MLNIKKHIDLFVLTKKWKSVCFHSLSVKEKSVFLSNPYMVVHADRVDLPQPSCEIHTQAPPTSKSDKGDMLMSQARSQLLMLVVLQMLVSL